MIRIHFFGCFPEWIFPEERLAQLRRNTWSQNQEYIQWNIKHLMSGDVVLVTLIKINRFCEILYFCHISLFCFVLPVFGTVGFGFFQNQPGLYCQKSLYWKGCRRIDLPGVLPVEKENARTARAEKRTSTATDRKADYRFLCSLAGVAWWIIPK